MSKRYRKSEQNAVCTTCGKCCYNAPLPIAFVEANKHKIVTLPDAWYELAPGTVVGLTPDERCPFLTKGNRCNAYDRRPSVCRKFGETTDDPLLWCEIKQGEMPEDMKKLRDLKLRFIQQMTKEES